MTSPVERDFTPREPAPQAPLPVERIAVFRALELGDMLCAIPALRALRSAYPQASVTLIGLSWAEDFRRRFDGYVDDFLEFPGFPGAWEPPALLENLLAFLAETQLRRFDLAIQMHGCGTVSNPFTVLMGARSNAGFYLRDQYCPDPERFILYPFHLPEVRRLLRLLEHLGIPAEGEELEFPLGPEDWAALERASAWHGLEPMSYVCIHPGGRSSGSRHWQPDRFAAVADRLTARGEQVVLVGEAIDARLLEVVAGLMHAPVRTFVSEPGPMGALIAGSRLVICNDTGIARLAEALSVPSVVLHVDTEPGRKTGVARSDLHRAISWASAASPESVLREADALLEPLPVYAGGA